MPTERPRLTITLTDRTARALTAASRVMKKSRGAIVLDLVDNVTPALEQLAIAFQSIERATPQQRADLVAKSPQFLATLDSVLRTAEATQHTALASLDLFAGVPTATAARPGDARSRTRSGDRRPPPVNKGGEPPRGGGSKVTKIGARGVRK